MGNLGGMSRHHELLQGFSHFFLTRDQINEQHIQRDEFEPKIINRLPKEREKKLVPWSLSPTQLSIVRAQCRGGIYSVACSTRKVEECGAVIISCCPLQRVTDRRAER